MANLMTILKVNLYNVFGINKAFHSKDKNTKTKSILMLIGISILGLLLLFVSFTYNFGIAMTLNQVGVINAQLGIMLAVSSIITLIFSISMVNGTLFGFKDYDILMSYPIKHSTIITSRLVILYCSNVFFCLFIMIPAMIVYGIFASPPVLLYIFSILSLLVIPLVPIIISTILGTIITVISSKFKHSNLITIMFYFVFFIGVIFVSQIGGRLSSGEIDMAQLGETVMSSINKIYPLSSLYIDGVCNQNIASLLLFFLIPTVLFTLYVAVISVNFSKINSAITSKRSNKNFKMSEQTQASQTKALLMKESKRYFSCSIYVINTSLGVVMSVIATVAAIIFSNKINDFIANIPADFPIPIDKIMYLVPYAIGFLVVMSCTSNCSISLEGKNLWILKSSPIPTMNILLAKIAFNFLIILPIIVCVAILGFILKLNVLQFVLLVIISVIYSFLVSFLGLIVNLFLPMLTWESEVVVVKQSAANIVSIFAGFGLIIIPVIVIMSSTLSPALMSIIIALTGMALISLCYFFLRTKGVKMFEKL